MNGRIESNYVSDDFLIFEVTQKITSAFQSLRKIIEGVVDDHFLVAGATTNLSRASVDVNQITCNALQGNSCNVFKDLDKLIDDGVQKYFAMNSSVDQKLFKEHYEAVSHAIYDYLASNKAPKKAAEREKFTQVSSRFVCTEQGYENNTVCHAMGGGYFLHPRNFKRKFDGRGRNSSNKRFKSDFYNNSGGYNYYYGGDDFYDDDDYSDDDDLWDDYDSSDDDDSFYSDDYNADKNDHN